MGTITRKFPRPSFSLSCARAFFALSSRSVFQYRRLAYECLSSAVFLARSSVFSHISFVAHCPKVLFLSLSLYSPIRARSLALCRSPLHQLRGSILLSCNRPNDRDDREREKKEDDDEEEEKLSLLLPVSMYAFSSIVFFLLI